MASTHFGIYIVFRINHHENLFLNSYRQEVAFFKHLVCCFRTQSTFVNAGFERKWFHKLFMMCISLLGSIFPEFFKCKHQDHLRCTRARTEGPSCTQTQPKCLHTHICVTCEPADDDAADYGNYCVLYMCLLRLCIPICVFHFSKRGLFSRGQAELYELFISRSWSQFLHLRSCMRASVLTETSLFPLFLQIDAKPDSTWKAKSNLLERMTCGYAR